jgi:hypothetical protein
LAEQSARHEALLTHLTETMGARVDALEAQVASALQQAVARRATAAGVDPAEAQRVGIAEEIEALAQVSAQIRNGGRPTYEFVMVLRPGDRAGAGWPAAAVHQLDLDPSAVAAYGERIDVIEGAAPTLLSRFEPVFDAHALAHTPCIEISGVVIRSSALPTQELMPTTGWDLLRVLATMGPLLAVPITASVGPIQDPRL